MSDDPTPQPDDSPEAGPPTASDPVLAKRRRVDRLTRMGQRVGYGLFAAAIVAFFAGFAAGYSSTLVTIIVACLIAGSAVLAPAIVFSYAVRAADRADREDDW